MFTNDELVVIGHVRMDGCRAPEPDDENGARSQSSYGCIATTLASATLAGSVKKRCTAMEFDVVSITYVVEETRPEEKDALLRTIKDVAP